MFNMKCPRCREGDLFDTPTFSFQKPFEMPERCSCCNQNYMPQVGFYYGAMFLSYVFWGWTILLIALFLVFALDWSVGGAMAVVIAISTIFLFKNHYFDPIFLSEWMSQYGNKVWWIYIAVSFIRGFFLIPSTPFVLLGIILFPDQPIEVLAVAMSGVVFSATLLYFFSDSIGFSTYLENKYPKQVTWMKQKLGGKYKIAFIYGWSIFPPVPTDIICYVSGIIKVRYWVMILGVFLGELTLNSIYVAIGPEIVNLFERIM